MWRMRCVCVYFFSRHPSSPISHVSAWMTRAYAECVCDFDCISFKCLCGIVWNETAITFDVLFMRFLAVFCVFVFLYNCTCVLRDMEGKRPGGSSSLNCRIRYRGQSNGENPFFAPQTTHVWHNKIPLMIYVHIFLWTKILFNLEQNLN